MLQVLGTKVMFLFGRVLQQVRVHFHVPRFGMNISTTFVLPT